MPNNTVSLLSIIALVFCSCSDNDTSPVSPPTDEILPQWIQGDLPQAALVTWYEGGAEDVIIDGDSLKLWDNYRYLRYQISSVEKSDGNRYRLILAANQQYRLAEISLPHPDTLLWAEEKLGVPVIDHWWQTETGWPMGANPIGIEMFPVKPGSCTKAVPGYDIRILDANCNPLEANEIGNVVIKLPLPPGCLPTLWNNDGRYVSSYLSAFPGYYLTADAGFIDDDGKFFQQ